MAQGKLTVRSIAWVRGSAASLGTAQFLWDTEVAGFGVKASPQGTVSYVVQKWIGGRGGKAKRIVIGRHPDLKLDDARSKAGRIASEVFDGADLVSERKQRREQQRHDLNTTLQPTIEQYVKRKGDGTRYWQETQSLLLNQVVPTLGANAALSSISKAQIRHLIETKQETHSGAARNMFAALRPFFKWAVERDLIAASPMEELTPPEPIKARDRILTPSEIKLLWEASLSMGYPFGDIHRLLLLTAQRRDEVAGMRRQELDLDKGEWIIPASRTKNGKEHLVHLSLQAIEIIQGISTKGDLVFTNTKKTAVSGFSNAKEALDRRCAILTEGQPQNFSSEFRIHDLRRTAASGMAELGFQPHIVERVLNHISGAQGGLVGVYQRFEYAEERRKAMEAWGSHVVQLLTNEPRRIVVALRR